NDVGHVAVAMETIPSACYSYHIVRLRFLKKWDDRFKTYIFKTKYFLKQCEKACQGSGTRYVISLKQFNRFKIHYPPNLSEQTAIAQVLSDVDTLLQTIDKLITKKQQLKTATMQQLLTGKRRLKGFTDGWEEKRLGDIAEIKKGNQITRKDTKHGTIPLVAGGLEPSCYIHKSNRPPEVVTISASGANAGYVAFHPCAIFASDCSTIQKAKNYVVRFIYYSLKLNQKKIKTLQTGGAQPHVYPLQLKNIHVYLPRDIAEQTTIAQVLSDMDREIEALNKKKTKYQQLKKAMMQQLLTGKIRLL
ncbi:MAG: restriction endonuclease subunit S, partial [Bacteroidota bacterium]